MSRSDVLTEPEQRPLSKTEQLVADVIAAGGRLTLPDETARGGVNWRQRAYAAQRHGKVPAGKRLSVAWTTQASRSSCSTETTGNELDAEAVPVPARLSKYHPVAREFRNRTNLHEVSRKALPRVLRIVHALATEAERRGYDVACVDVREDSYGRSEWKPARDGQLVFTINGHQLKVRIWEKGAGLRGPYERQMRRWKEDREQPVRLMQFVRSAQAVRQRRDGRAEHRGAWLVERSPEQLGRSQALDARGPFAAANARAGDAGAEAEERRLAKEREDAERQRQWELAMQDAERRLIEDHRIKVLRERVRAWEEADAIRAYCDAVEARHGAEVIADTEASEWLAFAREHADRVQQLPRMPTDPEITPEALKPYLGRWSPYGPERW